MGTGGVVEADGEVGAVDEGGGTVGVEVVGGAAAEGSGEVDGLGGEVSVEGARDAVLVLASVVVDTVGHVARLLYLGKEAPCADGVDATSRQVEDIALADAAAVEGLADIASACHLLVLLGGEVVAKSVIDESVGRRLHHIPHLGFPSLVAVATGCLVIGVHLDAEVLACVDELDEQGERVAVGLVDVSPHEALTVERHELVERGVAAVCEGGLAASHSRQFPTLAYGACSRGEAFQALYLVAAPEGGLEYGGELQYLHRVCEMVWGFTFSSLCRRRRRSR